MFNHCWAFSPQCAENKPSATLSLIAKKKKKKKSEAVLVTVHGDP
jgi:hypothetical protein